MNKQGISTKKGVPKNNNRAMFQSRGHRYNRKLNFDELSIKNASVVIQTGYIHQLQSKGREHISNGLFYALCCRITQQSQLKVSRATTVNSNPNCGNRVKNIRANQKIVNECHCSNCTK